MSKQGKQNGRRSAAQRPSQSQSKRSRSKRFTFLQLAQSIRERSPVWRNDLPFDEVVDHVHFLTLHVLIAARDPVWHFDSLEEFGCIILEIHTALDALNERFSVWDKFRNWPATPGIVFGEVAARSALYLIDCVARSITDGCLCCTGSAPSDLSVGSAAYRKWLEAARRKMVEDVELVPSADKYPDWQLKREWQALRLAFLDELRRYESGRVGTGGSAVEGVSLPPLSEKAAIAWEILLELPTHRGLTGTQLVDALNERGVDSDQSTLTRWIIPPLKARGVENKRKIGYFIPTNKRPGK